jgi:hypothetical protein
VVAVVAEESLEAGTRAQPQPRQWAEATAAVPLGWALRAVRLQEQVAALPHRRRGAWPQLAQQAAWRQLPGWPAGGPLQFWAPGGAEEQSAAERGAEL